MSNEDGDLEQDRQGDLATAPEKPKLERPPMYKVILLNDDFTPMEFVVHVLEVFFAMNRDKATQIMLVVHIIYQDFQLKRHLLKMLSIMEPLLQINLH